MRVTRLFLATTASSLLLTMPALAQDATTQRVDKLEREMRAVQRKVFGTTTPVAAEMQPSAQPSTLPGSSAPVADLMGRVNALESQLAALTGQVEEQGNRLRQLEARVAGMTGTSAAQTTTAPSQPAAEPPATAAAPAAAPTPKPATPRATPAAGADAARIAKIKAIEVPASGNAAEDSYTYAYRLWDAGLYPEAQAQLQQLIEKTPKYSRMSYARNLLGRAYLDGGQYENAVHTLYDNYKSDPKGDRAADSLLYLALAFGKMNNKKAACTSFSELFTVYGNSMNAALKKQATSERSKAGCS